MFFGGKILHIWWKTVLFVVKKLRGIYKREGIYYQQYGKLFVASVIDCKRKLQNNCKKLLQAMVFLL